MVQIRVMKSNLTISIFKSVYRLIYSILRESNASNNKKDTNFLRLNLHIFTIKLTEPNGKITN